MEKRHLKGMMTLYPTPIVLVSCQRPAEKPNIITLAWTGVVNSIPEMVSISIRPGRLSLDIIKETGEFVINIPTAGQIRQVDTCGNISGRDADKFEICGFTPLKSEKISVPMIAECPVNMECRVRQVLELGSHHMFIGEIVAKHISDEAADENGGPVHEKLNPVCFVAPNYYAITGEPIGYYGFSK